MIPTPDLDAATAWLFDFLHLGPRRCKDVLRAAGAAGVTLDQLQVARERLGVISNTAKVISHRRVHRNSFLALPWQGETDNGSQHAVPERGRIVQTIESAANAA